MNAKPQVIIIGAGFGGLEAAKKLACEDVRLTVIDGIPDIDRHSSVSY